MNKTNQGGGLSLLLTLVLLSPMATVAQTTAPGDDVANAAATADTGGDAAASAAAEAQPAAAPAPEPQAATEAAAPDTAKANTTSPFDVLPNSYFKHPIFMLFVLIVVVAFVWVLARRRVKKPTQ